MSKLCNVCNQDLPLDSFANQATGKLGRRASCKSCVKNVYRRTKKGLVISMHANQRAKSKKRNHPQPDYTKEELFEWCDNQPIFHKLYDDWVASNYDTKLIPTCDRLDDYKPYSLSNIQLMSWQDNSNKYIRDLKNGTNTKITSPVIAYNLDGTYHSEYHSLSAAARAVGTGHANIRNVCEAKPIKRTEKNGDVSYFTPKTSKGFVWKYK